MRVLPFLALLALSSVAVPAQASTVTFLGTDGLSDGSHLVGPYRLLIDGAEFKALCYDFDHYVSFGQTWQANLYEFSDLSSAYYSSTPAALENYQDAAWLLNELLQTTEPTARIGIQHAAWSLFSSRAPAQGVSYWLAAAAAARAEGYPGLNLTSYRVVNSLPGTTQVQGFIVSGVASEPVPEPATLGLVSAALLAFGLASRVRRKV